MIRIFFLVMAPSTPELRVDPLEHDFDPPIELAASVRGVARHWAQVGVPRGGDASAVDAMSDEEPDDGRRAGGRELPVARELGRGDRHVVGVTLDIDWMLMIDVEELRDLAEQRQAGRLQVGRSGIEEQLVGQDPYDESSLGDF